MQCFIILTVCAISIMIQAAPVIDEYAEDKKHRYAIALECIDQVQINRNIIEKAMSDYRNLPTDPKYKDYLACSYKKQKFQTADGKIAYDELYQFLSRFYDIGDLQILAKCKHITGVNDGEIAYNTLKCILPLLEELKSKNE